VEIKEKENLKPWSWWKVGGIADYFCEPTNKEDLIEALGWAHQKKIPFSVLGGGTNMLISDDGVEGLVVSTRKLNKIHCQIKNEHIHIQAEAGVPKNQLLCLFKKHKLVPALFLTGLPGDVGGGLVMNAGVSAKNFSPSEFSEIVDWFEVVTVKGINRYYKTDIHWSYRMSSGWEKGVILQAQFIWPMKPEANLNQQIKLELKKRRLTQPLEWPSCGSVFKNPYPHYAGQLIEQSALKGLQQGDAMISDKHGNFIINKGQATAQDIEILIQKIQEVVYKKFQILLQTEIHYLGRWQGKST